MEPGYKMYIYVHTHVTSQTAPLSIILCNTTCDHSALMSITQDGWTPLIFAAWGGRYDVVLDILDSGAEVNAHSDVSHYHLSLCHS